jgi:hypothetical protein
LPPSRGGCEVFLRLDSPLGRGRLPRADEAGFGCTRGGEPQALPSEAEVTCPELERAPWKAQRWGKAP